MMTNAELQAQLGKLVTYHQVQQKYERKLSVWGHRISMLFAGAFMAQAFYGLGRTWEFRTIMAWAGLVLIAPWFIRERRIRIVTREANTAMRLLGEYANEVAS